MKKFALIAALIGITAVFATTSSAQTVRQVSTSVPFNFTVSGVDLPAGDYVIGFGGTSISRNSVIIRSADGKGSVVAMVRTESVAFPDEVTGVSFEKTDGKYYLDSITLYALKLNFGREASDGTRLTIAMK